MKTPHLADALHCTGCGACANVCLVQAVSLQPDSEGFLQPIVNKKNCISCGKCTRVCPVLSNSVNKNKKPEVFAVRASDEIRKKSSSGGVFTLAAEWVLDQGGVVCGAAFDSEMQLHHTMVNTTEELALLRGSKYIQSDVQDIYQQVKGALNNGKKVLFVGTPCQVAALNNVTGEHKNLFTVDILCHGVPSQYVFNKYLSEISNGRKVKNVFFRDKQRFGWSCNHITIEFEDGSMYTGSEKSDAYVNGFFRNLTLRSSCKDCKFSDIPRRGDISLGDFWGIHNIDATQNDGKGTSIVLVNSARGHMLFDAICKDTVYKKETIDFKTIPNRVRAECIFNENRDRFFRLQQQGKPILESVDAALRKTGYDIGLVSNYCAENFGGILTHYALYHTLEDLGYSTLMISHPLVPNNPDQGRLIALKRCCLTDIYPDYAKARSYNYRHEMRELNNICDTFVVGSDQLFQYGLYNELNQFVSLDWVESRKKKIAVAASFGHGGIWGNPHIHADLAFWLSRYDHFSVRENDAVDLCRAIYGIEVQQVLDPVFLVDPKHYDALIEKAECTLPEKYVGFYILDPDETKANVIESTALHLGIEMTGFSEYNRSEKYTYAISRCNPKNYMTEERLKVMLHSNFFVTDSFHATCLSLIMHRPFIAYLNANRGASRFYSILNLVGLEDRLVTSYEDYLNRKDIILSTSIDWDDVDKRLSLEKQRTMQWLINALQTPKLNKNEAYDVLNYRLADINRGLVHRQNELENRITELEQQFSAIGAKTTKSIARRSFLSLIKGGIQCCHDHGLLYTVRLLVKKIQRRLHETDPK